MVFSPDSLKLTVLHISNREPVPEGVPVHRAGTLLFSPAEKLEDYKILVAKPHPTGDGNPPWQLPKGSLQVNIDGVMMDIDEVPPEKLKTAKPEDFETKKRGALRELEEETKQPLSNVKENGYDAGAFPFRSTTSGKAKAAHMIAAEAVETKLYPVDPKITLETAWLPLREFETIGREDQRGTARAIIEAVDRERKTILGKTVARDESRKVAAVER